jgi:hypothetical protein
MLIKPKKDLYEENSSLLPEEELQTSIPEVPELSAEKKPVELPVAQEPGILELYKQQMQKMEEETKQARMMDEISSLVNTLAPALSARSQARAIISAGSLGADPGPNKVNLKTNRAEEVRSASKDRMQALLDQYKLTNQLRGKKAEPKIMKVGDRVIQVTPTGEARELYKPSLTPEELEDKGLNRTQKQLQIQQLEKQLNKKPGDDLTLEQQEVIKADLDLKKVNLAKARQELLDSDKPFIEKQQGLANIQKTFADIKKTEAEVEKMNKTSELAPLDQVKIKESEARTKESEARTEKYKADSKRLEEDRKQKQEVADLQKKTKERKLIEKNRQDREELENANEKIKKVERLEKLLSKKGGVTGFFDNTVQSLIDSQRVDSEATARNIARQELMDLAVDQTLLKTAQTKGAISDQEMALFQKGIPSLYAQEPEWVTWLGKVKDTQKRLIAKIQETSPTSAQPEQVQVPQTSAAEKTKLSDKDKQALNWANSNPDDPRAMKIKQRLGM